MSGPGPASFRSGPSASSPAPKALNLLSFLGQSPNRENPGSFPTYLEKEVTPQTGMPPAPVEGTSGPIERTAR